MSTRDLDGVIAEIDKAITETLHRYGGGLQYPDYMRNVGREDALKDLRDRVVALKRRGGEFDEDSPRSTRRVRRGVSTVTDDWGPTPGDVVEDSPF